MKSIITVFALVFSMLTRAQVTPEISSWIRNTTGETGYGNYLTNVQSVDYTTTDVYVSCTCIPGYDIGPWAGNPNVPANQNFCFKITRNPQQNTGTPVATALGHIGVWSNGVSVFNALDAFSYNNQNVWHQDALPNEGTSFDNCLGHPAPNGEYHHHINPTCLYDDGDASQHSPIIGYAFDGFPIYGAYGFANTNGTGGIKRMNTSYRLRNITQRTTLPNGTALQPNQYGPNVNAQYPLGKYIEDYEYVQGLGDLDEHNGRFCITPDYPAGVYAYFVTIDSNKTAAYPYVIGPTYYGTVQNGNTGPGSGHNNIPSNATNYNPVSTIYFDEDQDAIALFPNPATEFLSVQLPATVESAGIRVMDLSGAEVVKLHITSAQHTLSVSELPAGMYVLTVTDTDDRSVLRSRFMKH